MTSKVGAGARARARGGGGGVNSEYVAYGPENTGDLEAFLCD